jgi:hypothetical protein
MSWPMSTPYATSILVAPWLDHMLFLQEKCVAAGMDYDQVLDKSAVWEGPVSTANTANGVTVKQDGDAAAKPGKHMHSDTWK